MKSTVKKMLWLLLILSACSISGWGYISTEPQGNDPARTRACAIMDSAVDIESWFDRSTEMNQEIMPELRLDVRMSEHEGNTVVLDVWVIEARNWKSIRVQTCKARGWTASQIKDNLSGWTPAKPSLFESFRINIKTGTIEGNNGRGETVLAAAKQYGRAYGERPRKAVKKKSSGPTYGGSSDSSNGTSGARPSDAQSFFKANRAKID